MRDFLFCVVLSLALINSSNGQYITVGQSNNNRNKPVKNKCDSSNNSALVEHFFNIIFNEFHNTPPGCVCVQMCPDQPTYCYPNGCLKRADIKKPEIPLPMTRVSENTKPIFFLEEKTDFIDDFLDKNYVDDNKPAVIPAPQKQDNNLPINLRPDPFKDRYKILFKYKKLPKVELKYNLGEQVRNMKSDAMKNEHVDVSKTRWPLNKVNPHFNGRAHSDARDKSNFFMSMFLDKEVTNYPPKYFKRELTNSTNEDEDGLDIKAIYVVGESPPENTTYSLESLIDNLIKSSFENKTTTPVTQNSTIITNETSSSILDNIGDIIKENVTIKPVVTEQIPNNESTRIISMNFTNENVDKNKYIKTNTEHVTSKFSDMIASLSKKIDMQNNTSLEMMRRMSSDIDFDSTTPKLNSSQTQNTTVKNTVTTATTENVLSSVDYDTRTTKKSRQRIARKLQNSKNN